MSNIEDNKIAFLNILPNSFGFVIFVLVLLIMYLGFLILKTEIYDNYQVKGYVTCTDTCTITALIPSTLTKFDELYIKKEKSDFTIIDSQIITDENSLTSYRKLTLKANLKVADKEIVELTFYYNKQRIITKIKEIIF